MKEFIKSSISIITVLSIIFFLIWNNYTEISSFLSSDSKSDASIMCVLFKTEIDDLESLVIDVNKLKMNRVGNIGFSCSSTEYITFKDDIDNPPTGSEVWGLYKSLINHNLIDTSLPNFLDQFFKPSIGDNNCAKITSEIRGWLNDPQMDAPNRLLINSAFE